jgi:hypothetical protein
MNRQVRVTVVSLLLGALLAPPVALASPPLGGVASPVGASLADAWGAPLGDLLQRLVSLWPGKTALTIRPQEGCGMEPVGHCTGSQHRVHSQIRPLEGCGAEPVGGCTGRPPQRLQRAARPF